MNMISTVFRNLISNAIKFTMPGGEIRIEHSQVENVHNFCISDNGIGMDEKTLKQLFDINNKTQRPGTSKESGTGLGLILCKEFVEKNNGSIAVSSKQNKGSSFCLTIPAAN